MSRGRSSGRFPSHVIPTVLVENHNDVLAHMYRWLASHHLPLQGNVMLHFDSHPDLALPKTLRHEDMENKDNILSSVDICSWIVPLLYKQHIHHLVWLKPYWSQQLECGDYHFFIGFHKETHELRATLRKEYFMSELQCCIEEDLSQPVSVRVTVLDYCQLPDTSHDDVTATIPPETRTALARIFERSQSWVLDIDLDSFATIDPFKVALKQTTYEDLCALYSFSSPTSDPGDEELRMILDKRRDQLTTIRSLIDHFLYHDADHASRCVCTDKASDTGANLKQKVQQLVINSLGHKAWPVNTTKDLEEPGLSIPLPHHVPEGTDHIKNLVACCRACVEVVTTSPKAITIARSSWDEYCPRHLVDSVQSIVLEEFKDCFYSKTLDVLRDYEHYYFEDEECLTVV